MQRATIQPQLDESSHTYTIDGRRVISVTQAMPEWVRIELYGEQYFVHVRSGATIPGAPFERARKFGNAVHKAAYYLITGAGLDKSSLHPDLIPTLQQLEDWIRVYEPKAEICEVPLYSKMYDYAGKPDFYGRLKGHKHKVLVDIKTGFFEMAEPQTAGYENLIREATGYNGIIDRYVLHLPKDGSRWQFIKMVRRDAFRYFLNELHNIKWREAA